MRNNITLILSVFVSLFKKFDRFERISEKFKIFAKQPKIAKTDLSYHENQ